MAEPRPNVVVVAGSNGSGKSTSAPRILRGTMRVSEFVNADVIARGLSAFEPERMALTAGKIMLTRLRELAEARESFAFETTLASRTFAPWIRSLIADGYQFHLLLFWLGNPELAIARVRQRVREGGHHVPDETVIRRYYAGIGNFFELYQPLAHTWRVYNNVAGPPARLIASGQGVRREKVYNKVVWEKFKAERNARHRSPDD
jgi:predicted ABC-type ATPase